MALMKKLTSAIVASSLVLGLVGTAGATTPDKVQTASDRMFKLGLVNGVTPGAIPPDMALNANLTRAQLVTILVRAFGQESNSKFLTGSPAFPDSATHWASGYIAMAKRIIAERTGGKEVVGMPDGTFNPDGNVTAAEAVAFLMKFVGAPQDSTLAWPDNYIQGAANAGLITAEDKAVLLGVKNAPATRGLSFYLADRTFYGYKLAEGGTTYTTFVDSTKPALTVDAVPATTLEEQVIVTGTVASDAVAVRVGSMDNAATVANGKFTATVKLTVGDNNILVHAVDLAGNASEQTVKVTKTVGAAASIEAADITVGAGEAVDVKAAVKDAKGNVIADAAITAESTVGTYAAGKFTAGEKAGEGTVTLKSGELTKSVKVTVTAGTLAKVEGEKAAAAPGEAIKLIAKDKFGNTVTGATFSEDSADAFIDTASGTFVGTKPGSYTVKATKGDLTVESKIGVFGDVSKLMLKTEKEIVANGVTEVPVTITATDKDGNAVTNFDAVVEIDATTGTEAVEMKGGVATYTLIASSDFAGSTIDITGTVDPNSTTVNVRNIKGDTSIEAVAQVATSIDITAPEYLPTNQTSAEQTVSLGVLDQAGESMTAGSWDMDVKITGPAQLAGGGKTDTVAVTSEEGDFIIVPDERVGNGTIDIEATFPGLKTAKATVKAAPATNLAAITLKANRESQTVATYTAPSTLPAKSTQYTIQLTDKNGVPVMDDDRTVRLKFDGVSNKDRFFVSTDDGGTWTVLGGKTIEALTVKGKVKVRVAGEVADKVTVTAVDPSGALKSSSGVAVQLKAAAPAAIKFAAPNLYLKRADSATANVTAQLYDAYGNKAAKAGVKLTFSLPASQTDVTLNGRSVDAVDVRTDANGQAKLEVGIDYALADDEAIAINASSTYGTIDTLVEANVTLKMAGNLADRIKAQFVGTTTAGSNTAGDAFDLQLTVLDAKNKPVTNLRSNDFKFTANDKTIQAQLDGIVAAGVEVGGADGVYTFAGLTTDKAGTLNVTSEIASVLGNVKAVRSLTIKGLPASELAVSEATGANLYADADKRTAFTLEFHDAKGNVVPLTAAETITFEATQNGDAGRKSPYVFITNASGSGISTVDVAAGRTNYKFYVQTNANNAEITISGVGTPLVLTVNPK